MQNDRDRLIELLTQKQDYGVEFGDHMETINNDVLADYLIANGVIVPPCKVGQTVYVLSCDEEYEWIDGYKVKYFYCSSKGINRIYIECGTMGNNFRPKDIGKTVFLTREEAEKALEEKK